MRICLPALALAVILAAVPAAATGPPSTDGWQVNVGFADGVATIDLLIDNPSDLRAYPGPVSWTWGDPAGSGSGDTIAIPGSGGAVLRGLELTVDADPQVKLNFWVEAGSTDTSFTIASNIVSFATIAGQGTATAAVTLTDTNGDGATATGLFAGGKFYEAYYNGASGFAQLVSSPISAAMYASTTASQAVPPWQPMGAVSSIQSKFSFDLSAYDLASGTSNFVVQELIPEPSGFVALLTGLVGLASVVTRRRR